MTSSSRRAATTDMAARLTRAYRRPAPLGNREIPSAYGPNRTALNLSDGLKDLLVLA
jgi:hypothetical protein